MTSMIFYATTLSTRREQGGREFVTYEVFSVSAPPTVDPKAAPTGTPAEKVAKASDRDLPGRNKSARTPNPITNVAGRGCCQGAG
jgi:hypothetical protein